MITGHNTHNHAEYHIYFPSLSRLRRAQPSPRSCVTFCLLQIFSVITFSIHLYTGGQPVVCIDDFLICTFPGTLHCICYSGNFLNKQTLAKAKKNILFSTTTISHLKGKWWQLVDKRAVTCNPVSSWSYLKRQKTLGNSNSSDEIKQNRGPEKTTEYLLQNAGNWHSYRSIRKY